MCCTKRHTRHTSTAETHPCHPTRAIGQLLVPASKQNETIAQNRTELATGSPIRAGCASRASQSARPYIMCRSRSKCVTYASMYKAAAHPQILCLHVVSVPVYVRVYGLRSLRIANEKAYFHIRTPGRRIIRRGQRRRRR